MTETLADSRERAKLDIGDAFSLLFMSTGGKVCRPCITALWPSSCHLWGQNHYFSKGAVGPFVWCGLGLLYRAMRENVEGKVECVCTWMCLRTLSCMWHGRGRPVKGLPGQTFRCPWQCTPGGAGLVKGPLRVLRSPGQKLGPIW